MFACDEAIIDGPPDVVFKAILDEYSRVTHWWLPYSEQRQRGNLPINEEGSIVDLTIRTKRTRGTPNFSYKLTKIVKPKLIDVDISGDIAGKGEWTFESIEGKTRLKFEWDVKPRRLVYLLLSPFVDMGKFHSEVMQYGYRALNDYLKSAAILA